jgi:quinone-modifying oxidoreductase subunit QmoB
MDKKYGVYICEGCGIGEALDIEALKGVAQDEGRTAKTHPILCSAEGIDFLKKEIAEGVNTLLAAGEF